MIRAETKKSKKESIIKTEPNSTNPTNQDYDSYHCQQWSTAKAHWKQIATVMEQQVFQVQSVHPEPLAHECKADDT